jgi:hypothetical protein
MGIQPGALQFPHRLFVPGFLFELLDFPLVVHHSLAPILVAAYIFKIPLIRCFVKGNFAWVLDGLPLMIRRVPRPGTVMPVRLGVPRLRRNR